MTPSCNDSADIATPSAHVRMRPDLHVSPRSHGGRRYWAVHDPVADQYFLLRDEEYFVLRALDGKTSPEMIVSQFAKRFAPRRLPLQNCWNFVAQLYQDGLVVSDRPHVGERLLARGRSRQQAQRRARWSNVLFIRLPGFNPTQYFQAAHPYVRWIYTPWFLFLAALSILGSIALVVFHWQKFSERWPDFYELMAVQNIALYAVVYGVIKVLHECGHGMTCVHHGGRVRELGVRLVLGFPCLYCDVSDSWMMARRRDRIAVAAAGIGVELVVAALACVVWWSTTPGLLNALARSVLIVSSVSTLLINGNPLLRFDGYFVLADLLDIPNLWSRSRAHWWQLFQKHVLDVRVVDDVGQPPAHTAWIALYGMASIVYQLVVAFGILWLARTALQRWNLDFIFVWLVVALCAAILLPPVAAVVRLFRHPVVQAELRPRALVARILVGMSAVAALAHVPLPDRVTAHAIIQACDAHPIHVREAGAVGSAVRPGCTVRPGEIVGQLENDTLRRELVAAWAARDRQRIEVAKYDIQRIHDDDASIRRQRVTALRELDVLKQRCRHLEQRVADLTLRAPRAGTVFPPRLRTADAELERLPQWSGSPLDACNQGAWLESRTLFCTVGDPARVEAWLHVEQGSVGSIEKGQNVRIYLEGVGGVALRGTITDVAEIGVQLRSDDAHSDTALQQQPWLRSERRTRPIQRMHHVRVAIESQGHPLLIGMQGRASIQVSGRSLIDRIVQGWRANFRFAG